MIASSGLRGRLLNATFPTLDVLSTDGPAATEAARICAAITADAPNPPLTIVAFGSSATLLPAIALAQRSAHRQVREYLLIEPALPAGLRRMARRARHRLLRRRAATGAAARLDDPAAAVRGGLGAGRSLGMPNGAGSYQSGPNGVRRREVNVAWWREATCARTDHIRVRARTDRRDDRHGIVDFGVGA